MDAATLGFAHWAMCYYINRLRALPYDEYLKTRHWQRKRRAKLRQSKYRCEQCRTQHSLDVHHLMYENRGCEPLTDLIVLCRRCHQREHPNGQVPLV
jgi:5-methylcytosine-specific restriction endonuclease McrA